MNEMRHPPSKELWRFCMDRLRELRGSDTRERDLANILGFEHSRAVRWKEGQMYVDRAGYLLRLADALAVDPRLLVDVAAGNVSVRAAHQEVERVGKSTRSAGRKAQGKPAPSPDQARASILMIAADNQGEADVREALESHPGIALACFPGLAAGTMAAEQSRPELLFLELGVAGPASLESVRVLSALITRGQRRCRVVAGAPAITAESEQSLLMAGAAAVQLFPFARPAIDGELASLRVAP